MVVNGGVGRDLLSHAIAYLLRAGYVVFFPLIMFSADKDVPGARSLREPDEPFWAKFVLSRSAGGFFCSTLEYGSIWHSEARLRRLNIRILVFFMALSVAGAAWIVVDLRKQGEGVGTCGVGMALDLFVSIIFAMALVLFAFQAFLFLQVHSHAIMLYSHNFGPSLDDIHRLRSERKEFGLVESQRLFFLADRLAFDTTAVTTRVWLGPCLFSLYLAIGFWYLLRRSLPDRLPSLSLLLPVLLFVLVASLWAPATVTRELQGLLERAERQVCHVDESAAFSLFLARLGKATSGYYLLGFKIDFEFIKKMATTVISISFLGLTFIS